MTDVRQNQEELRNKLQELLEQYDKIFFIPDNRNMENDILLPFRDSKVVKMAGQKILVLSVAEWPSDTIVAFFHKKLTEEEGRILLQLYYTYEFSDRFQILSRNDNFSGIWNLVDTGIITMEEAFSALLHVTNHCML